MNLYSTKSPDKLVDLKQAVFQSLPPDNGLYMPEHLPVLSDEFFRTLKNKSFQEISYEVAHALIGQDVPSKDLQDIIEEAVNFEAPIKEVEKDVYVLELFHGPSMAFKDFGARFMSRLMGHFLIQKEEEIEILVATSGDTGGAVALGFYNIPGVKVTILYPKGKVSPLQEQQLTTLNKNITALEVEGTFDDCQRLVKQAFLDKDLSKKKNLSSANSINIARLIPQTFYYFNAVKQLQEKNINDDILFSIPSGNFGNLTAGLFANRMGLPVKRFVASTNVNDIVPNYLKTGEFKPRSSIQTLSNAMDIGNPSNFERMSALFDQDFKKMNEKISGYSFSDAETKNIIAQVEQQNDYILCPHTAIAYAGLKEELKKTPGTGIFLSSAHPCKFPNVYSEQLWNKIETPKQVSQLMEGTKKTHLMTTEFEDFKNWLQQN